MAALRTGLGVLVFGAGLASVPAEAAVFTVNSLLDTDDPTPEGTCDSGGGVCTLREAMRESNFVAPGLHTINFNLPGPGFIITVGSALPTITRTVTIDGTTQAGWTIGAPVVELDGSSAPRGPTCLPSAPARAAVRLRGW